MLDNKAPLQLSVSFFQPKTERRRSLWIEKLANTKRFQRETQGRNLYIKNLNPTAGSDDVKKEFEKFGNVASAVVFCGKNGSKSLFSLICLRPHFCN